MKKWISGQPPYKITECTGFDFCTVAAQDACETSVWWCHECIHRYFWRSIQLTFCYSWMNNLSCRWVGSHCQRLCTVWIPLGSGRMCQLWPCVAEIWLYSSYDKFELHELIRREWFSLIPGVSPAACSPAQCPAGARWTHWYGEDAVTAQSAGKALLMSVVGLCCSRSAALVGLHLLLLCCPSLLQAGICCCCFSSHPGCRQVTLRAIA